MTKFKFFLSLFTGAIVAANMDLQAVKPDCECVEQDWRKLQLANLRFVEDPVYIRQRLETAGGQNPSYAVLSCADSRTPPELIFNKGLGKIFCPRVAGNTAGAQVIDSIAFAVATWDVTTIVVLGHTNCGAVEGALQRLQQNGGVIDERNGILGAVLIPIERAIIKSGVDIYAPNAFEKSTKANVAFAAERLIKKSDIIAKALEKGQIIIVGAIYDLETGVASEQFIIESCRDCREQHRPCCK
jgi:carbonic anhydrase